MEMVTGFRVNSTRDWEVLVYPRLGACGKPSASWSCLGLYALAIASITGKPEITARNFRIADNTSKSYRFVLPVS
jgi:hypothetical protein